jgi:cytoskeletal protein CcmA (bactofilin family)
LEGQAAGDKFGTSVALSADGTTLASGAPFANSSDGYVKVYKIQNASSKIIVSDGFDICGNLYAQYPANSIPLTAISANLATLSYVDSSLNTKASLAAPTFTGTVVSSGDLALNSKLRVSGDASFNGRVDICGNFYAKYPASSIPVSAIAASLATVAAVDTSLNLKASIAAPTFTGTVVSGGDLSLNSKLRVSGDASFNGRVDICGNFYAKYPASSIPASAIVGVSDTLSVTNINYKWLVIQRLVV